MLSTATLPQQQALPPVVVYPESDGQPMADNSKQFTWIFVLFGNLAALFRSAADVLVGGNLMWYAVEDPLEKPAAPDVFVVFGRPKGHRRSYQQWLEGDVPLSVVFEILSPKNTVFEMARKLAFYDEHGVEEYYVYDPDENTLLVYVRGRMALRLIRHEGAYTSARLGIRFDLSGSQMQVFYPDGQPFLSFEELKALQEQERALRLAAEQRADLAKQHADEAKQRAGRLAELGRKVRKGQASAEEFAELDRLEQEALGPSA